MLLDGKAADAIAIFNRALELTPTLQQARFNRAIAFLRTKENAKAAADLEVLFADEHSPLRAEAAYHLGIAYDRLGRVKDAETLLDNALKLDDKLDAALLYLGMLRERRNDLQGAGRAYLDYLARYPDSTAAMLRLGMSAHKAGRVDVAKTYLEKVVKAGPDSPDALEARKYLVMWE